MLLAVVIFTPQITPISIMPKTAASCRDSPHEEEGVTDNNNNRRLRHRPSTPGDKKMTKGGDDSGDVKSDDDSEDSCLETDTEESEEEDSDDGFWQGSDEDDSSSDEENKINKKKGRSKAKGRKKKSKSRSNRKGNGNPRSKKGKKSKGNAKRKQAAEDRFTRDLEKGNPNGAVGHIQKLKATGGNTAHRVQEILDGKKEKTDKYSVGYLESGGFFVSGTKSQLYAFGKDASKLDTSFTGKHSPFGRVKADLIEKQKNDSERVVFTTYEEGDDDIPDGCRTNQSLPHGQFPTSRKDDVFTYYFYHPEFKSGFDALKLAPFMKEDSDSESDSDSDSD
mmetsp:Transcript_8484/g.14392  ORF Transcript_8484/g.14392 Transcript_8484/m.14392 type:complete len:336 (-) Transcript_8484:2773-3780(-)